MRSILLVVSMLLLCLGPAEPANAWEWRLECVPFARALSGIRIFGDAWRWWSEAAGRYARGPLPQPGSVLAFRPSAQMPLGHVAVVTKVIGPRRIEIDHANWAAPGAISTSIAALDASARNDWSAVRVELGESERFGAVYATDGFIYAKGRPAPGHEQPELIYVGRALQAARQTPQLTGVSRSSAASSANAKQGFLPWNPVPLAPPMPTFGPQRFPQGLPSGFGSPAARESAHGRGL
jgi:hypothetical protein